MTNKEAIDMLTSIRDYLCNGNPIWKTEPIHDAVNMAIDALRKDEPTISKMEQVDKDINVCSKTEPQTDCDGCKHYADEYTADACYECKRSYADRYEPQTERSE